MTKPARPAVAGVKRAASARTPRSVTTSGTWILLDGQPFVAASVVEQDDHQLKVRVAAGPSAQSATLGQLQTKYGDSYRPFPYVYQDDAALVTLVGATRESTDGKTMWTLTLRRQDDRFARASRDFAFNTWSADAIAELRATRLLLGEGGLPEAARHDEFLMSMLRERGDGGAGNEPSLSSLWAQYRTDQGKFLRLARLQAVQTLRLSHVCDHIIKLTLGPIVANRVHVDFAGIRPLTYTGQTPNTITVRGTCPLRTASDATRA